jgi:hypothetical protein
MGGLIAPTVATDPRQTTDYDATRDTEVILLALPTLVYEDRSIDTSIIEVAVETHGETLQAKPGDLYCPRNHRRTTPINRIEWLATVWLFAARVSDCILSVDAYVVDLLTRSEINLEFVLSPLPRAHEHGLARCAARIACGQPSR